MKTFFIPLFLSGIFYVMNAQVTVSYSQIPFNPVMGASATCAANGNSFSLENRVSRSFFLNDFDIQNDFQIHKVSFAVQNILTIPINGFPVTINLYTSEGAYPFGELTLIGTADTILTESESHTVEVDLEALAPAGSEVVMEIHYDGEPVFSTLYIGANPQNDNNPAYIQADGCEVPTPTEVGDLGLGSAKWLMSIEGEDTVMGTVDVINSSKFSVYPNPVTESFSLKIDKPQDVVKVELVDLTGKQVKTFGNQIENLNVSGLAKGVYLLKVQTLSGKFLTQKIIKN